jgi:hypothetical protein
MLQYETPVVLKPDVSIWVTSFDIFSTRNMRRIRGDSEQQYMVLVFKT